MESQPMAAETSSIDRSCKHRPMNPEESELCVAVMLQLHQYYNIQYWLGYFATTGQCSCSLQQRMSDFITVWV